MAGANFKPPTPSILYSLGIIWDNETNVLVFLTYLEFEHHMGKSLTLTWPIHVIPDKFSGEYGAWTLKKGKNTRNVWDILP